jgi:hypothetical protein
MLFTLSLKISSKEQALVADIKRGKTQSAFSRLVPASSVCSFGDI